MIANKRLSLFILDFKPTNHKGWDITIIGQFDMMLKRA